MEKQVRGISWERQRARRMLQLHSPHLCMPLRDDPRGRPRLVARRLVVAKQPHSRTPLDAVITIERRRDVGTVWRGGGAAGVFARSQSDLTNYGLTILATHSTAWMRGGGGGGEGNFSRVPHTIQALIVVVCSNYRENTRRRIISSLRSQHARRALLTPWAMDYRLTIDVLTSLLLPKTSKTRARTFVKLKWRDQRGGSASATTNDKLTMRYKDHSRWNYDQSQTWLVVKRKKKGKRKPEANRWIIRQYIQAFRSAAKFVRLVTLLPPLKFPGAPPLLSI